MSPKRVLVGISGGVDSAAAALILKNQGYDVVGLYLCLGGKIDPDEAAKVADSVGIEFHTADLRERFSQEIEGYFIREYAAGRTPNPCVMCNRRIKFGEMLSLADRYGAEFLATGHYARMGIVDGRKRILRASDEKKDQSYMLYTLPQSTVDRVVLPLGELTKPEVRALAEQAGVSSAYKPDSQEICFIPTNDYPAWLAEHGVEGTPGEIVDLSGKIVGKHTGLQNYTVGQRKGLGGGFPHPVFAVKIDAENNRVVLGTNEDLMRTELKAGDVCFTDGDNSPRSFDCTAKIRYGAPLAPAKATFDGRELTVMFEKPQRAVTPGQSVVLYDGDVLLGGGVIE